jgi:hypothetical protein
VSFLKGGRGTGDGDGMLGRQITRGGKSKATGTRELRHNNSFLSTYNKRVLLYDKGESPSVE